MGDSGESVTLADLVGDVATVPVVYREHRINVRYWPATYSLAFVHAHRDASLPDELADLVESWDVVDEAGAFVLVTADALRPLPFGFLNAIRRAISAEEGVDDR